MAAPILWAPGKMHSFCRKNPAHKIPRFRGGYFGFLGGGREVPILFFMGARNFLIASDSTSLAWPPLQIGAVNVFYCASLGLREKHFRDMLAGKFLMGLVWMGLE